MITPAAIASSVKEMSIFSRSKLLLLLLCSCSSAPENPPAAGVLMLLYDELYRDRVEVLAPPIWSILPRAARTAAHHGLELASAPLLRAASWRTEKRCQPLLCFSPCSNCLASATSIAALVPDVQVEASLGCGCFACTKRRKAWCDVLLESWAF